MEMHTFIIFIKSTSIPQLHTLEREKIRVKVLVFMPEHEVCALLSIRRRAEHTER